LVLYFDISLPLPPLGTLSAELLLGFELELGTELATDELLTRLELGTELATDELLLGFELELGNVAPPVELELVPGVELELGSTNEELESWSP